MTTKEDYDPQQFEALCPSCRALGQWDGPCPACGSSSVPPIDDLTAVEVGLLLARDQSLELIVDGPGDPYLVRDESKPRTPRAYKARITHRISDENQYRNPVPAGTRRPTWKAEQ